MTDPTMEITNQSSPNDYAEYVFVEENSLNFYDVEITDPKGSGLGAEIKLDGLPMRGVISYGVEVGTGTPTKVTVTFYAHSINRKDRSA